MQVIPEGQGQNIQSLAAEIVDYLRNRESTADTVDGIANWWLARQRLREEKRRVERALQYLDEKGLIEKRVLADGSVLYSSAVSKEKNRP